MPEPTTSDSGGAQARREQLRILELQATNRALTSQNQRMTATLKEARRQLQQLRDGVDRLHQPPWSFGTLLALVGTDEADVWTGGRRLRVAVLPTCDRGELRVGCPVLLNDALVLTGACGDSGTGDVVTLREVLADGRAVVVHGHGEPVVAQVAAALSGERLRPGDAVRWDPRAGMVLERLELAEVSELLLEEVPDVSWEHIGGLSAQIEAVRDAVELPYRHPRVYADHGLRAPKGVLLYGPPGCGKTLIAKAVAASLSRAAGSRGYFLNIKGPELLNKYVGETERQVRLIFARAREKASDGAPVVVFFDEMESLFRTRGSGVSSDMETTVVPQLLAELDGVEGLANVVVIGASNREDLIDPAILRPGRLDVKIKIDRPTADGARDILAKHLPSSVPLHASEVAAAGSADAARTALVEAVVDRVYREDRDNEFLEVTYVSGAKEVLHVKDFASGAMFASIVARAKRLAVRELIDAHGAPAARGLRREHLLAACAAEIAENEELPNTTNPDDWARISGRKGERITFIRTLAGEGAGRALA